MSGSMMLKNIKSQTSCVWTYEVCSLGSVWNTSISLCDGLNEGVKRTDSKSMNLCPSIFQTISATD